MINKSVLRIRRDPRRRRLLVVIVPLFATSWLLPRLDRFGRHASKIDVVVADRFGEVAAAEADIAIEWGAFESTTDVTAERLTRESVFPVCSPSVCPNGTLAGAILVHRHGFPNRYDFPDWPTFLLAAGLEGREGIDPHAGMSVTGGMIMHAAREGVGVALANTTIAHDDLEAGRLKRPIDNSMETDIGYWLLTPRAVSDRTEVKAFRAWLMDEIADSVGPPVGDGRNS